MASRISPATVGLSLLAIGLSGHLMLGAFRQGWSQMTTDFPNHYVAAMATLHHQPLRQFSDWEWFQRQIHYSGIERQLGDYAPYTPLTMLPYLPLAELTPQRAKQAWLICEFFFLGCTVWLISRMTGLSLLKTLVLALLAHAALSANLLLGHYYIFLALLIACAAWCFLKGHHIATGVLLGLIFALKLYAAPFVFYFAVRRHWKAFWAMVATVGLLTLVAVAMFGWSDVWYFATNMLPRGLNGEVTDPYNPGLGSAAVLLRRIFVPEAELNPHPLLNVPAAFFFFRALFTLGILAVTLLAIPKRGDDARSFACFALVPLALSPVTATSHFVLLLVPVALLIGGESIAWSTGFVGLYILAELPLRSWNAWLFPKLWFVLALLIYAGWRYLARMRIAPTLIAVASVAGLSAVMAYAQWSSYREQPPMVNRPALVEPGAVFSSAASISSSGMVYESIGQDRFVLRASGPTGLRTFQFRGHAFHPSVPLSGDPVYFELLAGGHSYISAYHQQTKTAELVDGPDVDAIEPAISPDGAILAFVSGASLLIFDGEGQYIVFSGQVSDPAFTPDGRNIVFADGHPGQRRIRMAALAGGEPQALTQKGDCFEPAVAPDGSTMAFSCVGGGGSQVWILNLKTGTRRQITHGACNNTYPAWDPNSRSIVFATDCNRGVELPALFRVTIGEP